MRPPARLNARRVVSLGVILASSACGPPRNSGTTDPPPVSPGPPERHAVVVTAASGLTLREGTECTLTLFHEGSPPFTCRVELRCEGEVLYGLPGTGFNQCVERDRRIIEAVDPLPTRRDGDPMLHLDVQAGRLLLEDHDPALRLSGSIARQ